MLQRTPCINKIRMLQRTQTLQRTRRNIISRRRRVRITCRYITLWLERQSSSLLSFVRFSYQFNSVICLFVQCIKVKYINFILILHQYSETNVMHFLFNLLRIKVSIYFEHYLLIGRRRCTIVSRYISCMVCQLTVPGLKWKLFEK
jgi:hypothetical protein